MVDEYPNNGGNNTVGNSYAGGQGGWSENQAASVSSTEQPQIMGNQDYMKPKKGRHWLIVIVLLALLGLIGGGTVAAHFAGWITIPFLPRYYEPGEVLGRMYKSLPGIESAGYKIGIKVYTEGRKSGVKPLSLAKEQKKVAAEDRGKIKDIVTVIMFIQKYQQEQENNKYPSSLLTVTPPHMKEEISGYLNNGEIGYKVTDGGRDFNLLIKLRSVDFFNDNYSFPGGILINSSNMAMAVSDMNNAIVKPITNNSLSLIPADLRIELNMAGGMQRSGEETRQGNYKVDGLVKFGGSTFEGDIEAIMHKKSLFVRVNELSSLGFFDLSAIKGQWIRLESDEIEKAVGQKNGGNLEINRRAEQLTRQYKTAFEVAHELEMINVTKEYPMVKEDGRELYHYEIDLATEEIPLYYKTLTKRLEQEYGEEALFAYDEKIFKDLSKQQDKEIISKIKENTTMELWVDSKDFYPVKYEMTNYTAPPNTAEKFKGKQFTTVFSIALNDINQQIKVRVPEDYISADKAMELVSGKSGFGVGNKNSSLNGANNNGVELETLEFGQ